ncbi:unnamed protein product [Symbiodinium natans]|uniref:Uncharacterized protein n=1 Tax=Symbiodinium natans TaxID=878477 RepID=A0A812RPD2_9DINO|nr:unnamed protein product [Symbiodinium natans]
MGCGASSGAGRQAVSPQMPGSVPKTTFDNLLPSGNKKPMVVACCLLYQAEAGPPAMARLEAKARLLRQRQARKGTFAGQVLPAFANRVAVDVECLQDWRSMDTATEGRNCLLRAPMPPDRDTHLKHLRRMDVLRAEVGLNPKLFSEIVSSRRDGLGASSSSSMDLGSDCD